MTKSLCSVFLLMCLIVGQISAARAQGTAFTYQGRLSNGSIPVNGSYDLSFTLYANASTVTLQAGPVTNSSVIVTNGLFTTLVDFGPGVFVGGSNWLAIAVSPHASNNFSLLAPRQQVTPTPYALNVVGPVNTSQLIGTFPASSVTGLSPAAVAPPGMVVIPGGSFTMGNSIGDSDIIDAPTVDVTVSAFYMDANLVSLSQWKAVYYWAASHGYTFAHSGLAKALNHPVQTVDWYDCVKWCNARSEQAGFTPVYYVDAGFSTIYRSGEITVYANWVARGYRLPTEAEWERAARGGLNGQRFPWGNTIDVDLANYTGNSAQYSYDVGPNGFNPLANVGTAPLTTPAATFAPNGYGLYDMAGNLCEWCWDWYGAQYAGGINPRGPSSGSTRANRGGDWTNYAPYLRCASHTGENPSTPLSVIGFRAVLPVGQ